MQKLIALLLFILLLTVGLCACGEQQSPDTPAEAGTEQTDTAAIRSAFDNASAYIESVIDTSDMTFEIQDDNNGAELIKNWYIKGEPANDPLSTAIELDGVAIEIGKTTPKDLEELGFTLSAEATTVEPGTSTGFSISKGDKETNISLATNDTDKAVSIYDLPVTGVTSFDYEYALQLSYCGLNKGSTLKDLTDKLGRPNYIISLESDEYADRITVGYSYEIVDKGMITLYVYCANLIYDPESNSAAISQMNYSSETYPAE